MVSEAEKFKAEDEAQKERVDAKNTLENYCFSIRTTLEGEKINTSIDPSDKEQAEKAVKEALEWLDRNQLAEKAEFDAKLKTLEALWNPIMMKVYQATGGAGADGMPGMPDMPGGGGFPSAAAGGAGPTVEEVD